MSKFKLNSLFICTIFILGACSHVDNSVSSNQFNTDFYRLNTTKFSNVERQSTSDFYRNNSIKFSTHGRCCYD
jgi:hypothetical protein